MLFTGLIESTGKVKRTGAVLEVSAEADLDLATGESVCVSGSCLTVTETTGRRIVFDVSPETFQRIVPLQPGAIVNLERSLKADGRLHGHFVTGHVDCTGTVTRVRTKSSFSEITVSYPARNSYLLVEKGSVALSGISLTVAALTERDLTVALIPETLKSTSAGLWRPGTRVNLEFDIIGKYVVRAISYTRTEGSLREYLEKYQSETR